MSSFTSISHRILRKALEKFRYQIKLSQFCQETIRGTERPSLDGQMKSALIGIIHFPANLATRQSKYSSTKCDLCLSFSTASTLEKTRDFSTDLKDCWDQSSSHRNLSHFSSRSSLLIQNKVRRFYWVDDLVLFCFRIHLNLSQFASVHFISCSVRRYAL